MVFLHMSIHTRTVPKPLIASFKLTKVRLFSSMSKQMLLQIILLGELLLAEVTLKAHNLEMSSPKVPPKAVHTPISLLAAILLAVEPNSIY